MTKAKQSPEPQRGGRRGEQTVEQPKSMGSMRGTGGREEGPARPERRHHHPVSRSDGPFGFINRFAEELESMFEGFGRGVGEIVSPTWSPQIEAFEREGKFIVRADLPGLKKDDVKVELTDDAITIEGERKQEREEEREGWYRSERSYGKFFRSVPLPEGVNADEAKANFRDGVLEITMPAPRHEERRRGIEIQ